MSDVAPLNAIFGSAALPSLPIDVTAALDAGTLSNTICAALDGDRHARTEAVYDAGEAEGGALAATGGLSLLLTAEDTATGEIVGGLLGLIPLNVFLRARAAGASDLVQVALMASVGQIAQLTVREDWRGRGVGDALVRRAVQTYLAAGYSLVYGQFAAASRRLPRFYARHFDVLAPHEGLPLPPVMGLVIAPAEGCDERLFARWGQHHSEWAASEGFTAIG